MEPDSAVAVEDMLPRCLPFPLRPYLLTQCGLAPSSPKATMRQASAPHVHSGAFASTSSVRVSNATETPNV
jgi:hypothetical protein